MSASARRCFRPGSPIWKTPPFRPPNPAKLVALADRLRAPRAKRPRSNPGPAAPVSTAQIIELPTAAAARPAPAAVVDLPAPPPWHRSNPISLTSLPNSAPPPTSASSSPSASWDQDLPALGSEKSAEPLLAPVDLPSLPTAEEPPAAEGTRLLPAHLLSTVVVAAPTDELADDDLMPAICWPPNSSPLKCRRKSKLPPKRAQLRSPRLWLSRRQWGKPRLRPDGGSAGHGTRVAEVFLTAPEAPAEAPQKASAEEPADTAAMPPAEPAAERFSAAGILASSRCRPSKSRPSRQPTSWLRRHRNPGRGRRRFPSRMPLQPYPSRSPNPRRRPPNLPPPRTRGLAHPPTTFSAKRPAYLDTLDQSYAQLAADPLAPTTFEMTRAAHTLGESPQRSASHPSTSSPSPEHALLRVATRAAARTASKAGDGAAGHPRAAGNVRRPG